MYTKTAPVKVKADETDGLDNGQFEALVSVFDNVDMMGDKVLPGAFGKTLAEWEERGDPIPVLWSHRADDPNYHIGYVLEAAETDDGLWIKAQLDMDTPTAGQVYRLLKGRRVTQFSFAYDVVDGGWAESKDGDGDDAQDVYELRELRLYEVGPTLIGANPSTELLGVKAARTKAAIGPHETATSDDEWDGPANEARLSTDATAATYRQAYAWVDPDADPDTKAAYRFIHHNVSEDGAVGAANLAACSTGIAVLNGGRGGSTIPDDDRQGVYNHLAKHIRDAGNEPPELASAEEARAAAEEDAKARFGSAKWSARMGLSDVLTPEQHAALLALLPAKAGRVLSSKNEQKLRDAVKAIQDVLAGLGEETDDGKAKEGVPVNDEEPAGAKSEEPTAISPAAARLFADIEALDAG